MRESEIVRGSERESIEKESGRKGRENKKECVFESKIEGEIEREREKHSEKK